MFNLFPSPTQMFEEVVNGKLERALAEDALSLTYSTTLSAIWELRTLPIVGKMFKSMAITGLVSIRNSQLFQEGKIKLTVPKSMLDFDLAAAYQTEWINTKIKES